MKTLLAEFPMRALYVSTGLLAFVMYCGAAFGKIVKHKAGDGQTIVMDISGSDLNRIFVKGLRLHKLRAVKNSLLLKKDKKKGQYYIMPYDRERKKPINFFLQDEAGNVYTIIARPKQIASQTHMIIPMSFNGRPPVSKEKPNDYHTEISDLIGFLHRRALPRGYTGTAERRRIPLWKETDFRLIRRISGRRYIGEVYIARNIDSRPMTLHEKEFVENARRRRMDVKGVAVVKKKLLPGEETFVYIVSARK